MKRGIGLILLIVLALLPLVFPDTSTGVSVANSPPYLVSDIPNQTWDENEDLTNVFNLDDYFADANGDDLTFWSSEPQNIDITISSNNSVSFSPNQGFIGLETATFYATDGTYNSSSNLVYLSVGEDNEPPKWFSPSKDQTIINQNDIVTFTTNWTDNIALKNFIFSTNQTGVWTNHSSQSFSGTQNISSQQVQISAPENTLVAWRFYASDTSNNLNATSLQFFNVVPPEEPSDSEGENETEAEEDENLLEEVLEELGLKEEETPQRDFNTVFKDFRVGLKQGTSRTSILEIINTGTEELSFDLIATGIEEFTIFSETSFSLAPGDSKQITIDFDIGKNTPPDQYFGTITIIAEELKKDIPVVLEVNELEQKFGVEVGISEGYETVKQGENASATIKVSNLEDVIETNATLYVAIKDSSGNTYSFEEEQIIFSSEKSFEKELYVPEDAKEGNYLFYARVSNSEGKAIRSEVFEVGTRFKLSAVLKTGSIFLGVAIFAAFLSVFMIRAQRIKKRERILELYLELNQLKKLIKANKLDEALELYLKIKSHYNEPVTQESLKNKDQIKKEILSLAGKFEETKKVMKKEGISPEESEEKQKPKHKKPAENKKEEPEKKDSQSRSKDPSDSKQQTKKEDKNENKKE